MDTYIYNEILSGTIDGVNKEFTTLYNIDKIEEVYLGGVSYRDISFSGNVVTFGDAPPVGADNPTIDYFKKDLTPPTPTGDVTFGDIITETYDIIDIARKTTGPFKEDIIKRYINKGIRRIKNTRAFKERILSYSFNKSKDGIVNGYDANTITIGEQDYVPANGMILLSDSSFIEYTGYTGGDLAAIAGYVYSSGSKFSIGYKVPSGVKRVSEVILNGSPLVYVDNREFSINNSSINYTIIHNTDGDKFIFLPYRVGTTDIVTVKYTPTFSLYTDDSDIVDIEYDYTEVLATWAAYKVLLFREDDRWQAVKQEYKEALKEWKAYKGRAVDGINNKIRAGSLTNI